LVFGALAFGALAHWGALTTHHSRSLVFGYAVVSARHDRVSLAALAAAQAVCGLQYVREKEKTVFGALAHWLFIDHSPFTIAHSPLTVFGL